MCIVMRCVQRIGLWLRDIRDDLNDLIAASASTANVGATFSLADFVAGSAQPTDPTTPVPTAPLSARAAATAKANPFASTILAPGKEALTCVIVLTAFQ